MAKDPYKYFRIEARELIDGLSQGVLALERDAVGAEQVTRLLRLAHTLKGAARVVKQPEIAELSHAIEGVLGQPAQPGDAGRPLAKERASELLRLLDEISSRLKTLEPVREAPPKTVRPVAEVPIDTLRVEMHDMESLLRGVTEAGVQLGALRKNVATIEPLRNLARMLREQLAARPGESLPAGSAALPRAQSIADELLSKIESFGRSLTVNVERVGEDLNEIREVAHRLRLIPVSTVFPSLERVVRDAAQTLGKRVNFEAAGGEIRLDASTLIALRDALMHVARNAVAHGIEAEAERTAARKPAIGQVRLAVERRGSRVAFVVRDDGRGVNLSAVKSAAVSRGLLTAQAAESLSPDQVLGLLRTAGFSTAGSVTELSGRGIGLDMVHETAVALKGEFGIRSEPGRGVTVQIEVPISVASLQGLVVEAAGMLATIPLDAVEKSLRIKDADVGRAASGDSIVHGDGVIPFLPLDRALRRRPGPLRRRRVWSAVVVKAGSGKVAVGVDRLLGATNVVMRSLPAVVEADPIVWGASLDAEGNPQLVLDPGGLVQAAERPLRPTRDEAAPPRAPILVIDDSLTTRRLEQSILESAGYEVNLAVSAEEALIKARERRYSLFIVDVEMPGMDGFEFVTQTRADPVLRAIPAILVTSRNAVEDRRRGEQAGASAYIVKGEFDQGLLLQNIRRLLG